MHGGRVWLEELDRVLAVVFSLVVNVSRLFIEVDWDRLDQMRSLADRLEGLLSFIP